MTDSLVLPGKPPALELSARQRFSPAFRAPGPVVPFIALPVASGRTLGAMGPVERVLPR